MTSHSKRSIVVVALIIGGTAAVVSILLLALKIGPSLTFRTKSTTSPDLGRLSPDYVLIDNYMGRWVLVQANDGPEALPSIELREKDDGAGITHWFASQSLPVACGLLEANKSLDKPFFLIVDAGLESDGALWRSSSIQMFSDREDLDAAWRRIAGYELPAGAPFEVCR